MIRLALIALALAGWTTGVAYYANEHGKAVAERLCQEERDAAQVRRARKESEHAEASRRFEKENEDDERLIAGLQARLSRAARSHAVPPDCRLGAERLRIWNEANGGAGAALPGEPAGEVPDAIPGASER